MPIMVRQNGKAKKIAYNLLGIPVNMASKKTSKQYLVDEKLQADIRRRIR